MPGFVVPLGIVTLSSSLFAASALAATAVSTLSVSAVVLASPGTCLIDPVGTVADRQTLERLIAAVKVRCTGSMPYQVDLEPHSATDLAMVAEPDRVGGRAAGIIAGARIPVPTKTGVSPDIADVVVAIVRY